MEDLPTEILDLIQKHKFDIAAEKLRDSVISSLTSKDYDTAANALIALSHIESKTFLQQGLPSLHLALVVAQRANEDSLQAEVLYKRAVILLALGDETSGRLDIDIGLVHAQRVKKHQLTAQLLQLRLLLNLKEKTDKQDLLEEVRKVSQVFHEDKNVRGQLNALISGAVTIAPQNSLGAITLLDEAEILLNTIDRKNLEGVPQSSFIQLSPSESMIVHSPENSDDIKSQWLNYIKQQRVWISKLKQ